MGLQLSLKIIFAGEVRATGGILLMLQTLGLVEPASLEYFSRNHTAKSVESVQMMVAQGNLPQIIRSKVSITLNAQDLPLQRVLQRRKEMLAKGCQG